MSSSRTPANGSSKTTIIAEAPKHLILQMALRDVSVLFRTPWIIITRALSFIIQLFVFAFLISGLIHIPGLNFFEYYAVGSVVATIASISFVIGYDIFEEAEEGVLDYLLTLPIARRQFIIGRALGGAMRAIIYTIPMFVIVAFVWGFNQPLSIFTALFSLSSSSPCQGEARLSTQSLSCRSMSRCSPLSRRFRLPLTLHGVLLSGSLWTFPR